LAIAVPIAASGAETTAGTLRAQLTTALKAPDLPLGRTAAYAVDLRTGKVVFAHNATRPFVPASNEKLPVAWAALKRLGPSFRFRSEVIGVGRRAGTAWVGSLVLKGYGDPTLTMADLDAMARTIHARGIREVKGRVLGDETYFDARRDVVGWKSSFLGIESPPLSALIVDRGLGWPKYSPPRLAAKALRNALARRGVRVTGTAGSGVAPPEGPRLADDTSAPLTEIVRFLNQHSDNFTAEMLLKQLGVADGLPGTTARGAAAVMTEMEKAGIPTAGVRIVDGSGLSRLDRLTAHALVATLQAGLGDPEIAASFAGSLAVAGRSGTLTNRLVFLRGAVRGKTGTTDLSCSLSGLVRGALAFAVIENGTPVPAWSARSAQDRFVTILAAARGQ
jgi:D-alanyl-D-alanine carboxypeptidase/D-alanyl-D-alanine-endopeptidase (penicillin-binding protein 4)